MPVYAWYQRSSSPEIKAKGIEVARLMVQELNHCTTGNARLIYGNGDLFNVHVFDNLTYRVVDANTPQARVIFTALELDSEEVNDEGQYKLIIEEQNDDGVNVARESKVLFLEEKGLKRMSYSDF
ncbi:hypothetical protein DFH28DRAFT_925367 [Melampsora americana]|nr:hypothetical protein DFH28DRAFT_925367 [Melampsora americana]